MLMHSRWLFIAIFFIASIITPTLSDADTPLWAGRSWAGAWDWEAFHRCSLAHLYDQIWLWSLISFQWAVSCQAAAACLHEFACHPFAGTTLIFSVSIPIYHMCCLSCMFTDLRTDPQPKMFSLVTAELLMCNFVTCFNRLFNHAKHRIDCHESLYGHSLSSEDESHEHLGMVILNMLACWDLFQSTTVPKYSLTEPHRACDSCSETLLK